MRIIGRTLLALVALLAPLVASVTAQEKSPPTTADYGQWEAIGREARLSPDGAWLTYAITRSNGENELRVASTTRDQRTAAAFGEHAAFSSDSQWLAYAIGHSEDAAAKLDRTGEPVRQRMGVLDLTTLETEESDDVAAFAFSERGVYLAVQRYAARADGDEDEDDSDEDADPAGADLVVRALDAGAVVTFANVSEFSWQDEGTRLAMTVAAEGRTGNGVQLYDAATGRVRTLDSASEVYTGLSWRQDADDLVVLRTRSVDGYDQDTHVVLAWRGLSGASEGPFSYDQAADPEFPADTRIVSDRPVVWSDAGDVVLFGIKEWEPAPQTDEPAGADEGDAGENDEDADADETAEVDVWHSRDERIIPMQKVQASRDRRRSLLAAWHVDANRFVQVGTDLMEEMALLEGQGFATALDTNPYAFESMFGRRWMDVHLINVATGERAKAIEGVRHFHDSSATGRYLLYFKDDAFWTHEIATGRHVTITGELPTSFANAEYDYPTEQRPAYGVAGWEQSDEWVLLYDRYDIWRVAPDGSAGENLTGGSAAGIRHRYVATDEADTPGIDLSKPLYVSLYGQWTKKHGLGRLRAGGPDPEDDARLDRLVWLDKQVDRLIKADEAERYAYAVQGFDDSPDFFVSGPNLSEARQVSETNPFQQDYAWGRSELVDFSTPADRRLQGALFYPANYDPGRQYPMIVYVYERRSQVVHTYVPPTERRPYNTTVFTSHGYFVLQPDIVYRDRDPGVSATECVEAAVEQVLETGMIDRGRVGLVGHSWGGYEASFIPTQTNLFAAAVAGAPLTNFFSMFGTIHWNQGMPESSHFETGQARMDVPYWDDMGAYVRNSPVMFIRELETPMLVAFGDADGTVDWHQGVELYNYARRAGKQLVMLVYADENHGLRRKPNQMDYHHRVLDWFGHFLKGEEAPAWVTDGVSELQRQKELNRRK